MQDAAPPQRSRIRIYDDGDILLGYEDVVDDATPAGAMHHYARGPDAKCRIDYSEGSRLTCEDNGTVYMDVSLEAVYGQPTRRPELFFTHDGSILVVDWSQGLRLINADGNDVPIPTERQIHHRDVYQESDTLFLSDNKVITVNDFLKLLSFF